MPQRGPSRDNEEGSNIGRESWRMILGKGHAAAWVALTAMAGVMPGQVASQPVEGTIDYARQIHALLAAKCLICHSQEKRSGVLSPASHADVPNGGTNGPAEN